MKKINPQIKNEFTLKMQDEIDAIEMIADMFFREVTDEDGNTTTKYTPYLEKIGQVNAIVRYFLEGIEFEDGEDVYDAVMDDKNIEPLVMKFMIPYGDKITSPTREQKIMGQIMDKVYDIVEFRKANILAQVQNEANSVLTYKILELIETEQEKTLKEIEANENLNAWIDEQRKQQEELNKVVTPEMQKNFIENFNANDIVKAVYSQISEGDIHKKNQEIVELSRQNREKDNKIIELQTAFAKEQQKESVKNVLADDKKDNADKPKTTRKRTTKSAKTDESKE
ncbi:hypothetical protein [Bariatricus sp. SGI.019]|uniref:hypothetical protein n=1 Tax=Bariatricus sp. SGI.019 TaxID=3420548 RepID=UPI003CFC8A06